MDCLQNQIKHTRADGSIWYESDGFCCNAPCAGYEHYAMNEPDRGAENGFEAMRGLDWNNDNRLDAIDPAWSHLRLWRDSNRNGVSESGETSFISASEIESLELDYHVIGRRDSHGNRLRYKAMMTLRGNARRPYYDVLFVHE